MTEPSPPMVGLLDLPKEIRLHILGDAIAIRRPAPPSPSQSQPRTPFYNNVNDYIWTHWTNIYVEVHNGTKSAQFALLAVNKRLREETLYLIGRLAHEPYHVDVMYVDKFGLLPTLVAIPCLQKDVIPALHVTFRLFEFPDDDRPDWMERSIFLSSGAEVMRSLWSIMVLLTLYALRMLRAPKPFDVQRAPSISEVSEPGSQQCDEDPEPENLEGLPLSDKWCAIRSLSITVDEALTPGAAVADERNLFGYTALTGASMFAEAPGSIPAPKDQLAREVARAVGLMELPNHPFTLYRKLLLTYVGRVEIMVGGSTYREWDLTRALWVEYAELDSSSDWGRWAIGAKEKKERLGMGRNWAEAHG